MKKLLFSILIIIFLTFSVQSLPVLKIVGSTHREVGIAIGKYFSTNIQNFITGYSYLSDTLLPFYNSTEGRTIFDGFLEVNALRYPLYAQELEGVALGSNVPLYILQLLNLRTELRYWTDKSKKEEKKNSDQNCADIHVHNGNQVFLGHNEDATPSIKDFAYLLDVEILESGQKFVAYTYPGLLSGNAFGWNSEMTFSFNYVAPLPVTVGLARAFINRDILTSTTLTDVIARATQEDRAFGFTLNLGDIKNQKTYCLEIAPTVYSVWEVKNNFSHFNEYKILNILQSKDESTEHRQKRANQFPVPLVHKDVLDILGDNLDSDWPIYRNSQPPDHVSTVATVLFDLSGKSVSLWDTNPKIDPPSMVLSFP